MRPDMDVLFVNDLGGWYRLEHDRCLGAFEATPEMLGPDGCVRPSILATQADMVGGALSSQAAAPRIPITVDLTVRGIERPGTGKLLMVGRLLRAGRRTTVVEVLFSRGDERPLVLSHATFMPAPDPKDSQEFMGDRDGGGPSLARPFVEQLGIRSLAPGVAEIDRTAYTMQPTGTIQGGAVAAVAEVAAETAAGRAVRDLEVRYLAAVRVGPARATAEVFGAGQVRVEVRDRGNDDRLASLVLATVG
ncbi:MAG TPA: PaaI family thioesterase [Acidimicrobiales bacterium]|nr:PaaI family thioesterase [Acidimicrobiales bacterium]